MNRYVLVAGVNGAGKSTLYYSLRDIQNLPRVNTDEIVRSFGDWKIMSDVMKAGKIAVGLIKTYIDQGISFNQETTLCGKSIVHNITKAIERGFSIELHYVGLESVNIAKQRIRQRVLAGGHDIPDEDIERRYKETFLNARQILNKCDLAVFYDNTIEFRRIAIYKKGELIRQAAELPKWYIKYFI